MAVMMKRERLPTPALELRAAIYTYQRIHGKKRGTNSRTEALRVRPGSRRAPSLKFCLRFCYHKTAIKTSSQ